MKKISTILMKTEYRFFFFNFLFFFSLPSCNHYSIVHEPEKVSVTDFFYASGSSMTQQGAASQPTDRS